MRIWIVVAALAVAAPARADDDGPSPATALELSGGITAGGAVLGGTALLIAHSHPIAALSLGFVGAAGFVLGPSTGHWYAGNLEPFGETLVLAGLMMPLAALLAGWGECGADKDYAQNCTPTVAYAMLGTGAAAIATGMAWDIATAGSDARRHRRISLAPLPVERGAGLALTGRF